MDYSDKLSIPLISGSNNAIARIPKSSDHNSPNTIASTISEKSIKSKGSIEISGRGMVMSRLFGQDETTYTGEVKTNKNDASGNLTPFLTSEDRSLLEDMYVYSAENGIDLKHVDALAADLAGYRRHGNSDMSAELYDLEGHQLTIELSATNKGAAERIAKSETLQSTRLDANFVRSELDASGHAVNHDFLERMVDVFSTTAGSAQVASSNRGPIAAYSAEANKLVVTASKDVRLVIPEADYSNVDGVGHWRTPELEQQNQLATQQTGVSALSTLLDGGKDDTRGFLALLDGYAKMTQVPKDKLAELISLLDSPKLNAIYNKLEKKYD